MRCLACLFTAALLGVACGGSDDGEPAADSTVGPSDDAPTSIEDVVDGGPADVAVSGYVVIDRAGSRLCAVLLESFPPQCGPPSIDLVDLDDAALDLREEQTVQWTDDAVVLRGRYADGTLSVIDVG